MSSRPYFGHIFYGIFDTFGTIFLGEVDCLRLLLGEPYLRYCTWPREEKILKLSVRSI